MVCACPAGYHIFCQSGTMAVANLSRNRLFSGHLLCLRDHRLAAGWEVRGTQAGLSSLLLLPCEHCVSTWNDPIFQPLVTPYLADNPSGAANGQKCSFWHPPNRLTNVLARSTRARPFLARAGWLCSEESKHCHGPNPTRDESICRHRAFA